MSPARNTPCETRPAVELVTGALAASPGSTAAGLAVLAGLGQSTVSKVLAAMEVAGTSRREVAEPVGGRRPAACWYLVTPTPSARAGNSLAASAKAATHFKKTTPAASGDAGSEGVGSGERLRPGQLGTLVLEYLLARAEQEQGLSPAAVANSLGRSSGAVANAMAKFAATGDAVLVSETPRRYRIATA